MFTASGASLGWFGGTAGSLRQTNKEGTIGVSASITRGISFKTIACRKLNAVLGVELFTRYIDRGTGRKQSGAVMVHQFLHLPVMFCVILQACVLTDLRKTRISGGGEVAEWSKALPC